jgi:hypothetical protein
MAEQAENEMCRACWTHGRSKERIKDLGGKAISKRSPRKIWTWMEDDLRIIGVPGFVHRPEF